MKVRKGFVSNSSSSSFVCDLSGGSYEGYDGEYQECTKITCVNGHKFNGDEDETVTTIINEGEDDKNELSEENCPICNGRAKPQLIARLKQELVHLNLTLADLK